jgi:tRNA pseudouridine13 synthase
MDRQELMIMDLDLHLPYITDNIPGIGGRIKAKPEHFQVIEIPLYEPSGNGDHLYVNITKENMTTRQVQVKLAKIFDLKPHDIGKAGLKDKNAVTTQTFSILRQNKIDEDEAVQVITDQIPIKVNWAKYHTNKLRAGHLLGNKFKIRVTDVPEPHKALNVSDRIKEVIHKLGLPNYYGYQRIGKYGENVKAGREIFNNKKRTKNRWLDRYLISSFQSHLCNRYLVERVDRDLFTEILKGDIAKKHDTGGLFTVENPDDEQRRYVEKEISFTAPIYGYKMMQPLFESKKLEEEILNDFNLTKSDFREKKVKGTRRLGRIIPEITVNIEQEDVELEFSLPKGAFATTVVREFTKNSKY